MPSSIIEISNLSKTYRDGFQALKSVNLEIKEGEIFALLGPNGAGKTTLINIICGLANLTSGSVKVAGFDIVTDFRKTRELIGLVPQELTVSSFEKVTDTVNLTRGLFGKPRNLETIEHVLKALSLWEKRNSRIMELSGGMKRRVLIAKALSHEPKVLFLDEPTAGVDVELRKDMWKQVHKLRKSGVTIILTTHYIEEAEEMADRVGVINNGEIILVEEKNKLMKKLGSKRMALDLRNSLESIPESLSSFDLSINGSQLIYHYDSRKEDNNVASLFECLRRADIEVSDVFTKQSSLEDIFVELVKK